MRYTKENHAIGLGLMEELPKLTPFKYRHILRDGEITVSNDNNEPIGVIDIDGTIDIWTTNEDDNSGPIGLAASIELANPNFLDEIVYTLIRLDSKLRYIRSQKRLNDGFGP